MIILGGRINSSDHPCKRGGSKANQRVHKAQDSGYRVHKAQGTGHRVHKAQGTGLRVHKAQGTGHRVHKAQGTGYTRHRTQGTQVEWVGLGGMHTHLSDMNITALF